MGLAKPIIPIFPLPLAVGCPSGYRRREGSRSCSGKRQGELRPWLIMALGRVLTKEAEGIGWLHGDGGPPFPEDVWWMGGGRDPRDPSGLPTHRSW